MFLQKYQRLSLCSVGILSDNRCSAYGREKFVLLIVSGYLPELYSLLFLDDFWVPFFACLPYNSEVSSFILPLCFVFHTCFHLLHCACQHSIVKILLLFIFKQRIVLFVFELLRIILAHQYLLSGGPKHELVLVQLVLLLVQLVVLMVLFSSSANFNPIELTPQSLHKFEGTKYQYQVVLRSSVKSLCAAYRSTHCCM